MHSQARNETLRRYQCRTLETQLLTHKAEQPLSPQVKRQTAALELADPGLFEDLINRKKWRQVCKDPSKTMRDVGFNDERQLWTNLNSMPASRVNLLLDDRVIDHDRQGCDNILNKIYGDAR